MPKLVDHQKVIGMLSEGFPKKTIAERIGCSTKQVRRIEMKLEQPFNKALPVADPEIENALREHYLNFESAEKVSERFGITRQAVLQTKEKGV